MTAVNRFITTFFRWTLRGLLAVVLAFALLQLWFLGHVVWWKYRNPAETAFMAAKLEQMKAKQPNAKLRYEWVPYDHISVHLKRAVVAAEDARFMEHHGFDWDGIQAALEKNSRRGKVVAGGSTITQQLAKNLFLSGERSLPRKVQEAIITVMIEALWDKRRILEVYLNVVEWGEGVYGAGAAARHHYGTSAAALTRAQAAELAVMLPRPRHYDRVGATPYLAMRADRIEARLGGTRIP